MLDRLSIIEGRLTEKAGVNRVEDLERRVRSLEMSMFAVLLLTVPPPPCPAICKTWGHVLPVPYRSRRNCGEQKGW